MVVTAMIVVATATQVSSVSWPALLGMLASVVTILGGALWLWKQTRDQRERNERFDRDWYGEDARPGVPKRPGVLEQLQTLGEDVSEIKVEVFPNHGGSIKDMVTRTDLRLEKVEIDVKGLHDRLDATTTTTTVTTVTAPDVHA